MFFVSLSEQTLKLGFFKLTPNGYAPQRSSAMAAGFDLRSAHDTVVPKLSKQLIKTDICLVFPKNCYGRIAPRSGLALNNFLTVGGGVVDPDYRGNIGVILFNHDACNDFNVKKGDKIAQIICEQALFPEVREIACLEETERGHKGFGSTGLR